MSELVLAHLRRHLANADQVEMMTMLPRNDAMSRRPEAGFVFVCLFLATAANFRCFGSSCSRCLCWINPPTSPLDVVAAAGNDLHNDDRKLLLRERIRLI
mmetsp:Transcript_28134/g.33328  ORF Transcript_28134/g.33328 Transcript_28134/m.33328 type:complete len:100 (+) Transcript_28134:73-372(+)